MLGLLNVKGSFRVLDGELSIGADGEANGSLRVDAASVQTGIGKRDNHLRSADFFHVAQHPHVEFTLRSISVEGGGAHTFSGALHVRGHQIPLTAPLRVEALGGDRLRLSTTAEADHASAGLGWAKPGMIRGRIPVEAQILLVRD
jgi:polyisoprenoid-binding protein YceI